MDRDAKVTPLKAPQGMIWAGRYIRGELHGDLHPDVAPCLRRWLAGGARLFVCSSGSVWAQRLIFGHSVAGNLAPLFTAFLDTGVGGKREAWSYDRIAVSVPTAGLLFLSDIEAELDAAAAAGLRTSQVARPQDGTPPVRSYPTAVDFAAVAALFSLPE